MTGVLRRPAFALTATATIALAIAANTLMFGLIRGILLNPLPLPDADRLVRIEQRHQSGRFNLTGATFVDLHARSRTLASVAAFRTASATVSTGDHAAQVSATTMTPGYFSVLGLRPVAGRLPDASDFSPGAAPAVFVSETLWRRVFAGETAAIGRPLLVNAAERTVAGVFAVPASAPGAADVWLPLPSDAPLLRNRRAQLFTVIGRLRVDATSASAAAELDAIAGSIRRDTGDAALVLLSTPLRDRMTEGVRSQLFVLWGAVGVLLVIAFANVANLLLMQGSLRARELSLRTALGATRLTLMRTLAIESAALGVAGGAAGAALAALGLAAITPLLPAALPRVSDVAVDGTLIAAGIALSVVCSLIFGLVPAVRASRGEALGALRTREGVTGRSILSDAFVAAQVALTVALLFGAGVLGRSLLLVNRVPLGFDPDRVMTLDLSLPGGRYATASSHAAFYGRVLEQLATSNGVSEAAVTGALPLSPTAATTMVPQDGRNDVQLTADVVTASPRLFAALRIPLVRGRLFTDLDRAGGAPAAVVNETAARQFWPVGIDPIGRTIEMRDWGSPYSATVVGIVGDVRQQGPDQPVSPAVFYPFAQFPETTLTQTIVVRSDAAVTQVIDEVRAAVARVDPNQPIARAETMTARIATALAPRRFDVLLLAAFAASALLLATVGVYGIVAFAMASRTREIGVRMALGAAPRQIARLAAARGAGPMAIGILAGAAASMLLARMLETFVFGVATRDGWSLAAATLVAAGAALVAVTIPARRAMCVDPVVALRDH